jgi:PAS domain S-box-containing protein
VQRRVLLIVPLTAVFTLLIAALLGLAITRSITGPLGRLMEGSQALAGGEFHHQVLVVGQDELAQLGQVFNLTAARLRSLYETLHKREAYLAEAQRLSHAGSWAWHVGHRRIFWSEETFHIFGVNPNITPTREIFLERVHPDDRAGLEPVEAALSAGHEAEYNYRIVFPDSSIKYLRSVARPVTNDSGQVVEFVGTVIDVTDRKQAEEERERLREAQADLAHISRVTTMGELTASLAHEIKQPIAAAVTNAKTCLRWLGRDQPDVAEARQAAARLVNDVTRAAGIISSLNLLFKKGGRQRELVDVNELIREMIVLLRSEANRYSISIRSELATDLPNVMADPVQLQQVFMNLMLNGIEAMKNVNGAGELIIKSQQASNDQLLISVSDTGVGLPAERADQIFDAFFTTKPQGLGMGLSISRSIIESHGGRLWAAANSGPGACFQFVLPTEVGAGQEFRQRSHEVHH